MALLPYQPCMRVFLSSDFITFYYILFLSAKVHGTTALSHQKDQLEASTPWLRGAPSPKNPRDSALGVFEFKGPEGSHSTLLCRAELMHEQMLQRLGCSTKKAHLGPRAPCHRLLLQILSCMNKPREVTKESNTCMV